MLHMSRALDDCKGPCPGRVLDLRGLQGPWGVLGEIEAEGPILIEDPYSKRALGIYIYMYVCMYVCMYIYI